METRIKRIFTLGLALFLVAAIRAVFLHLIPPDQQKMQSILESQYRSSINIDGPRGSITDRRGRILAQSLYLPSLFVNPREFSPSKDEILDLSKSLSIPPKEIEKLRKKSSSFAWLKRRVSEAEFNAVQKFEGQLFFHIYEASRFYPLGDILGSVIGHVNDAGVGQNGIEQQFDFALASEKLRVEAFRDARRRLLFSYPEDFRFSSPGKQVVTTIDAVVQEIAHSSLLRAVANANAKGGAILVMDPRTGDILAAASLPSYNPNLRITSLKGTRSQAISDTFEPGSVVKPLVAAAALKLGKIRLASRFDTNNGIGQAGGILFRDSHPPPRRMLTTEEIIVHSSNVGVFEIAKTIGPEALYSALRDFSFGTKKARFGFPGQELGSLDHPKNWLPIRFANIAFGQGFTASLVELGAAYSAIATGGLVPAPRLLKAIKTESGRLIYAPNSESLNDVISRPVARDTTRMLQSVVEKGATLAQSALFSSAGKTGTSQKVDPLTKKYSNELHHALFVGFGPTPNPRLVVAVMIDEPGKTPHYGALWAAPAFSETLEKSLIYLNVAPDKLKSTERPNVATMIHD